MTEVREDPAPLRFISCLLFCRMLKRSFALKKLLTYRDVHPKTNDGHSRFIFCLFLFSSMPACRPPLSPFPVLRKDDREVRFQITTRGHIPIPPPAESSLTSLRHVTLTGNSTPLRPLSGRFFPLGHCCRLNLYLVRSVALTFSSPPKRTPLPWTHYPIFQTFSRYPRSRSQTARVHRCFFFLF